jgi:two-component system response regulator ChvI
MMMTISGVALHTTDTFSTILEPQSHPSILLINHDAGLVGTLKLRLTAQGFDVRTASDGLSALEELRRIVPDAIVIDIDAPRAFGVTLAEEMRDWGFPVVLTTAWQDRPVIAGAECLEKPYEISNLVDILSLAIERGKAQAEPPARGIRRRVLPR